MKKIRLKDSNNEAFIGIDTPEYGGIYLIAEIVVNDVNTFQTDFIKMAGRCSKDIQLISIHNYVRGAKLILPEVVTKAIRNSFNYDVLMIRILGEDIEELELTGIAKGLVKRSIPNGKRINLDVKIQECKVHNIVMREIGYTDNNVEIRCVDSVVNNVTSIENRAEVIKLLNVEHTVDKVELKGCRGSIDELVGTLERTNANIIKVTKFKIDADIECYIGRLNAGNGARIIVTDSLNLGRNIVSMDRRYKISKLKIYDINKMIERCKRLGLSIPEDMRNIITVIE